MKYFIPLFFFVITSCKEGSIPSPTSTPPARRIYHGNITLANQNAVAKFAANHYEIIEGGLQLGVAYDPHNESGSNSSDIIDPSSLIG